MVQEAFLRLTRVLREGTTITSPKAYLATTTTRLAISHLRSARVRRESYVGAWLPEPLVTSELGPAAAPDPAERAEMSDSLSMAFLVLLESLSPTERAVFLLHEVFGYDYREIADITGKSEANCRRSSPAPGSTWTRAGRASRPPGSSATRWPAGSSRRRAAVTSMVRSTCSPRTLVPMGDGGGKGQALLQPTHGSDRVARFLLGLFRRAQNEGTYGVPPSSTASPARWPTTPRAGWPPCSASRSPTAGSRRSAPWSTPTSSSTSGRPPTCTCGRTGTYPGGHGH